MIIRKTPKDKEKYIMVSNEKLSYKLQSNGFMPKYIDNDAIYFVKTKEIEEFISLITY